MSVKINSEICPRCGGLVAFHEDSVILRAIVSRETDILNKGSRHIQCDPSVAQYVCHPSFPPIQEKRQQYDKQFGNPLAVEIKEEIFTEAWLHLQEKCGMTLTIMDRSMMYGTA
jgi:hypothetical protein